MARDKLGWRTFRYIQALGIERTKSWRSFERGSKRDQEWPGSSGCSGGCGRETVDYDNRGYRTGGPRWHGLCAGNGDHATDDADLEGLHWVDFGGMEMMGEKTELGPEE